MNKRLTTIVSVLLLVSSIVIMGAGSTTSNQPGSVDDPVITKSYFDENVAKRVADELSKQTINEEKIKQIIASELAKISPSTINTPSSNPNVPSTQPTIPSSNLTVLKLEQGQTLYGGSGTEFIVRTGKVNVFSSDESGIADVTSGKDIAAGSAVDLNHLLIVPREGRGIKPDPKNKQEIFVMVRGNYLLTNPDGTKATP